MDVVDQLWPPGPEIEVLDGDTIIFGSEVVRLAGIDAPELGPWADCWAEAALAGHSREQVRALLSPPEAHRWKIVGERGRDANDHLVASLARSDGEDLSDILVVEGLAAETGGNDWDWCAEGQDLRDRSGPNIWYPTGHMLDPRARD